MSDLISKLTARVAEAKHEFEVADGICRGPQEAFGRE